MVNNFFKIKLLFFIVAMSALVHDVEAIAICSSVIDCKFFLSNGFVTVDPI